MMPSVPLSILALGLLTLFSSCDSTAQEARPVMLINDTDQLIVFTSRPLYSMAPDVSPPLIITDTSDVNFHLAGPHQHKLIGGECKYYDTNSQNGWIARIHLYGPLSSDGLTKHITSYSFWSYDPVITSLIENDCQIRISDVGFLERLVDMSGP